MVEREDTDHVAAGPTVLPIGEKVAALFDAPAMAAALAARVDEAPAMPPGFSGRVVVDYQDGMAVGMAAG